MKRKTGRCGRKVRFPDEYKADRILRKTQQIAEQTGGYAPVRWYWHRKCDGFHLTSEEGRAG
jgi:hypothetical protein